jgi:ABC-2 type transport system ATP-binding protein
LNTNSDTVIEVEGLTKHFGPVVAVEDLSLQVPRGGVFGLLGPNGSGKTTTMGMLLGLIKPTRGSIRLFGQDVGGMHQTALRRIGAIVESPSFYPYLSGRANLRFFQGIGQVGGPQEVDRLLELVDLSQRADSKYQTYSLGMKQRLGIAFTLLGDPELVFLDEPTNGLDPAGVAEVRDLIRRLGADGRTVVLSSHLLYEVEQVCDRVAILSRGRLIVQGSVRDLVRRQGTVRLKTTDDAEAQRILASLGWVSGVRVDDGYLVAEAPPDRAGDLTRALAREEVFVVEMAPSRVSLERYFLEVTGEPQEAMSEEVAR